MKKIILFISLFFASFTLVNASTSYIGLPHVEVDNLPEAEFDLIGTIYDYNEKYYVVEEKIGGYRNIEVGDNLYGKALYFEWPQDICEHISPRSKGFIFGNSSAYQYNFYENSQNGTSCIVSFAGRDLLSLTSLYFDDYRNDFCAYSSLFCTVKSIDEDAYSYQFVKIVTDTTYEWKEISYYDWYEYSQESTDFYLLFNFNDITSFDIFSNYNFSSFTDFEKLTIVFLVNMFFIMLVGICIYILIKVINKALSWLF